jgi:hypothetical protein
VATSGLRLGGEQKRVRRGPHQTRSGHVSVPDPCLGPVQGPGMLCPGILGPLCGRPGPHTGGGGGVRRAHAEVRNQPWGPRLYIRGSGTNLGGLDCISGGSGALPWGSGPLLTPWSIPPSLDTWRLRTRPRGGVGRCCGPRIAACDWGEPCLGPTHSSSTT